MLLFARKRGSERSIWRVHDLSRVARAQVGLGLMAIVGREYCRYREKVIGGTSSVSSSGREVERCVARCKKQGVVASPDAANSRGLTSHQPKGSVRSPCVNFCSACNDDQKVGMQESVDVCPMHAWADFVPERAEAAVGAGAAAKEAGAAGAGAQAADAAADGRNHKAGRAHQMHTAVGLGQRRENG
jgi:hypothetical protein